jgi:uncharacterized protein (TIGR03067 family)
MKANVLLFLVAGLLVTADAPTEAAKKELDQLQGTWTPVKLEYNGKDLSADGKSRFRFVFKGDQATVEGNDEVRKHYAKVTFKLDPSATPKWVDLTVAAGIQQDAVIEGIYELKDDTLTLCAKVFGKERPTEFASPDGSSIVLLVLKRE